MQVIVYLRNIFASVFKRPNLKMRTRILLTAFLLLSSLSNWAQLPSYIPANGLVAWYPFNGNANDESGNGNNASSIQAQLSSDRFNQNNKSFSFNGATDFIEIPHSSSFEFNNSISISAWINVAQLFQSGGAGFFPIISKSNQQFVYGTFAFGIWSPNLLAHFKTQETGSPLQISFNEWQHVIVIISNGETKFYNNGNLIFSGPSGVFPNQFSANLPIRIGNDRPGLVEYANGKIDDIGIWNRALTIQEINSLYTLQAPCQNTSSSINATITEGDNYSFNGQNLSSAGSYLDTLQNASGCDSLVTLNLTVEPAVEPLNCQISASETSVCLGETAGLSLTSNPSNTMPSYQIGDATPSGGIVFYDKGNDSNGWRYLEVMPVDYSGPTFYTGCYCSSIEGTTNSLGSGYENSQIWASTNCSIVPFDYSYGGFTGWYLPSVAELTQIYTQLSINNSFSSGAYWSSNPAPYGSCGIDGGASVLNFSNGSVYSEYRNGYQGSGYARLVRRFIAEPINNILWSTGETTPSISVSPTETTTYSVTVTQGTQTCTSEVTITVNQPSAETVNATITEGETYSFNGQNLTAAGTYTATLQNAAGCDSVVTLNLTVTPAPVGGCYAASVVNFSQGQRADATNVTAIRSNPELALGMPEPVVTNVANFVSLGFGGSITLAFEAPIANGAGNDIRIDEATWNNNPCNRYPETADVFASQDGSNFVYLGRVCQDAELDLGQLSWAQYVRLVDVSDLLSFNADADGFDVNGIECLNGAATSLNDDGLVACSLQEIVSYTPGNRKNGTPVGTPRNNPSNALGTPQNNNTINFTALGFGGTLVGKFDFVVFNQPGNDLRVTETSFGNPSCNNYPEKARVSVSMDNVIWTELGEICQDGEIDLGAVNYAQYIKIQDASPMSSNKFNGAADGYDVDAVMVLNNGCGTSSARLAQLDNTTTPDASMSISAFPNPMEDYTIVNFEGLENDADFTFQIMDAAGRVIRNNNIRISTANPTYLFDASELARGIYQVVIANDNGGHIIRLVK